ncbi:hypothetical protein BV394_02835 [Brevirhabdus pacifica]|uniref:Uncharacterized protein n=1 Tax=Brevirhabdus pacifica TaxID=1267768 RepID=A0A1U7DFQ7_9RHOB|nr:hypothetical protein [Brevirhabdus pacifica]APX88796.1 hypothetical protein BV394_02835 [Brevirhabdus pacifica]OWU80047.1 hypothetical protein ATO5_03520 [Loktanella sp. 22II-4b]PJJ86674.1 hypothetical protein CLV77_1227 [Brevirhabdus pacifica]
MEPLALPALVCALAFAAVHLATPYLTFFKAMPRSRWLSFAGGVAVAYVFLHLLPELSEHEATLAEGGDGRGIVVYALALAGLAAFYALERMVKLGRAAPATGEASANGDRSVHGEEHGDDRIFWIHITSFALYNLLIGYLLLHREEGGWLSLGFYFVAMGLHFLTSDFGLNQDYPALYRSRGRWVLSLGVLGGWLLGVAVDLPEEALIGLFAFLAGGVVLNVLKEELPEERKSSLAPFLLGVAGYGALLIAL